jgi:acetyl-CoA carboxylase carboxyl transferase subunit alpha
MKTTFLDFEQPIAELEAKIEELRFVQDDSAVDISEEIERLSKKSQQLTKDLYANLTPWQVSHIPRTAWRPQLCGRPVDRRRPRAFQRPGLHGDRPSEGS